jgi:outer membrane protein insertion porin family
MHTSIGYKSILSLAVWGLVLTAAASLPATPVFAAAATANGDTISEVRVEGNQRVEGRTILSYLGLKAGNRFSQGEIDNGLKNLFATGFFSDVKLLRDGSQLVVRVIENPVINRIAFEGNDRMESADLEKELELQPRSVYSREKVQSDVRRILDLYRRSGRYNATVVPKVIQQDQNRVDLVYEITEGPVARIEKISFIGNEHFTTAALREAIRTEEARWYKFLTDNDKYDPDRLQYDQELLRRFYINEGYADFQVKSAHAELSPNKDAFYLTFVVDEGPQYKFGDVKVTSELPEGKAPDFSGMLTTKSGDTYDASKVEASIDVMTKELGNKGYAFVDIQPRLERDRDQKLAHLTYTIKPGPRVYVERINVTGNVRTLDEVVRREFRLREGDPYNSALLQRSEQRINNLGFFEKVQVKNEPGSAPDKTVVNVDVQEKSTGEINMGAGYSTTDGVLGDFGIRESNLLGRGQELRARVTYATRRKQVELGFTEPYFLDRDLSAGFDLYRVQQDFLRQSDYNLNTEGVTLRMRYALQEKLQHALTYSLRQNDVTDVSPAASLFIRRQEGSTINSAVAQAFTYDDRDNKFNPTTGYYARLYQELAGLGGDARYLKHELKGGYYYPLYPKWTLSFAGSGGYMFGLGRDVRISDRFFIGGDDLRGFQNSGVGPRDIVTTDALGGNIYYIGTTEMTFPVGLPEEMGVSGAVFTDVGSLWNADDSGLGVFDESSPRVSAGIGMLWTSPFGPIRIDFAHAIVKENPDRTENVRFSFGTRF